MPAVDTAAAAAVVGMAPVVPPTDLIGVVRMATPTGMFLSPYFILFPTERSLSLEVDESVISIFDG